MYSKKLKNYSLNKLLGRGMKMKRSLPREETIFREKLYIVPIDEKMARMQMKGNYPDESISDTGIHNFIYHIDKTIHLFPYIIGNHYNSPEFHEDKTLLYFENDILYQYKSYFSEIKKEKIQRILTICDIDYLIQVIKRHKEFNKFSDLLQECDASRKTFESKWIDSRKQLYSLNIYRKQLGYNKLFKIGYVEGNGRTMSIFKYGHDYVCNIKLASLDTIILSLYKYKFLRECMSKKIIFNLSSNLLMLISDYAYDSEFLDLF